jgi:hypothetical protein
MGETENVVKSGVDAAEEAAEDAAKNLIDGIEIIDDKVGGKIPVDEYKDLRTLSFKNANSDSITLGKYTEGEDSYIKRAGKNSSYFDLGEQWGKIKSKYGLTNEEMFNYFNRPVLDDAIAGKKMIKFSHDPRGAKGFLGSEWNYIKNALKLTDDNLMEIGGMWYVR